MHSTVADHLGQRTNRIDQIRLGAAVAVVFGHSWHLSRGPEAIAPLEHWLGLGIHELAVHVFFFLSGLLITQSALRHQGRPLRFAFARLKRIVPALWVHALLLLPVLTLLGVATSEDGDALMAYAARLMSIVFVDFTVPGLFADNPFPEAVNGSVWSLRHELIVYGLVGGAGALGALHTRWGVLAFVLFVAIWISAAHLIAPQATGGLAFIFAEGRWVMASFLLGVICHRTARYMALRADILIGLWGLAALALITLPSILSVHLVLIAICYSTLLLAFAGKPECGLSADLSYAIYIYGWPVQQVVVLACMQVFGFTPSALVLFGLAMGPLAMIAFASWHWVEQPALKLSFPVGPKRAGPVLDPALRQSFQDAERR
ncbi:MAG: acyltransferase [Pseudomonadota bacterium]